MNALKQKFVERAEAHQAADDFRQGFYWDGQKGCCVGCLAEVNDNAHESLFRQSNIPKWLSMVADTIHEGLTLEESKLWPVRFIKAVPEQVFSGEWAALEIDKKLKAPFLIMVLRSTFNTFDHAKFPYVKSALDGSIALWERDDIGSEAWAAARAAGAPAWAAREAEAAWAARAAGAPAWAAARAAAWAAGAAAWAAARAAAWAAGAAAWAAGAAAWAAWAARAARYDYFAKELIRIMEEAK